VLQYRALDLIEQFPHRGFHGLAASGAIHRLRFGVLAKQPAIDHGVRSSQCSEASSKLRSIALCDRIVVVRNDLEKKEQGG
jgi:hypothetical protein